MINMEQDKLSIKLKISDRYYPLRIEWDEEEKLRKAAKDINDVVRRYKERYSDKDDQDILAMALIQFVAKLIDAEEKLKDDRLEIELKSLCDELDELLDN